MPISYNQIAGQSVERLAADRYFDLSTPQLSITAAGSMQKIISDLRSPRQ
jgi:hypothetical protein